MLSVRRGPVARRLAVLTAAARDTVRRRERLREQAKAARSIRLALVRARIAPAGISCLRRLPYSEAELGRRGDTPELRRADAGFIAADRQLASARGMAADVSPRVPRFAGRPPPDPGASLYDWYAWSLASRQGEPDCRRVSFETPAARAPQD